MTQGTLTPCVMMLVTTTKAEVCTILRNCISFCTTSSAPDQPHSDRSIYTYMPWRFDRITQADSSIEEPDSMSELLADDEESRAGLKMEEGYVRQESVLKGMVYISSTFTY